MIETYFSVLITKGILVRDDESGVLETDGFISYNVADDYVLLGGAQRDDDTYRITYVQLVQDEDGRFWVAQLEGLPEDPINVPETGSVEIEIYKKVGLYD